MIVFIDDSGDPGFKIEKGSSTHFTIAMVCFDDDLEAEKTAVAIKELKRKLKLKDNEEFKFSKSCRDYRIEFLKIVNKFNFRIRCLVVDKTKVYSPELQSLTRFDQNVSRILNTCAEEWPKFIQMEKWTMYQMYIWMISNNFEFKIVSFEVVRWVI